MQWILTLTETYRERWIVVESISNCMMEDQGADLRDEGGSGAGYWLVEESADGKEWLLIARFTCFETALEFSNNAGAKYIAENE